MEKDEYFDQMVVMLHEFGHKPKRYLYIPVKDINGIVKDKYLKIVESGSIYKKLLNGDTKIPNCWIIE
jgi:hypothetical protein